MKLRNILTSAAFALVLFLFAGLHILLPDEDVSVSERRKLELLPKLTVASVMDGSFGEDLETYLLDHFPFRDQLRSLKAAWLFDVYGQSDNNGIYLAGDQVCKLDSVLNEDEVTALIANTNKVCDLYLQGMDVSFALIPDKNYYAADANGYPALDYDAMELLLHSGLADGIRYLGMTPFRSLTLDDYYRTDIHWRQERLQPVADALSKAMGFASTNLSAYEQTEYSPFYGTYYGQSALNVAPDTLVTLSNAAIDSSIVTVAGESGTRPVYDDADFTDLDGYNVFLGGPQGIITLENPNGTAGKELIIFRDSFGSSLAPLLLGSYDKITLIDLRYVLSVNVGKYVEFTDQDVLFLYSTSVVNTGKLLK